MALKLGITMLIHNKDDIEFVTEFPCFLGHPVVEIRGRIGNLNIHFVFIFVYYISILLFKIISGIKL